MKFGDLLKEIRTKHGDSLRKLGDKTGMIFTYIDKIEKGQTEPSENIIRELFRVYPTYRKVLSEAYIKEKVPQFVLEELKKEEITTDYLDRILVLLQLLGVNEQKILLTNIVEKVELSAYQNGTLLEMKDLLEEIKEKIEEL